MRFVLLNTDIQIGTLQPGEHTERSPAPPRPRISKSGMRRALQRTVLSPVLLAEAGGKQGEVGEEKTLTLPPLTQC